MYATFTNPVNNVTSLYTIDPLTGNSTRLGDLPGGTVYTGFAFALPTLQSYGLSANTARVGAILDNATLASNATVQGLISNVDAQTTAQDRNRALLGLTPAGQAVLPQIIQQSLITQDNIVRRYIRDVRAGGTGNDANVKRVGSDRRVALWLQATGREGHYDAANDRFRTKYGFAGLTGGADVRLDPTTLIGLYGGYDDGRAKLTPFATDTRIGSWFAGAYGTVGIGPFYIDGHGFYGKSNIRLGQDQVLRPNSAIGQGTSDPDTENYGATATTGFSFDFGGFEFEPYGGARWVRIDTRSTRLLGGAGGAESTVRGYGISSLEGIAGVRVGADFKYGDVTVRPSVRGEYRHEFENGPRNLLASFNYSDSNGGQPFLSSTAYNFRTSRFDQDYADVAAGFTISGVLPFNMIVEYQGQYGRDRQSHGITGGLRLTF